MLVGHTSVVFSLGAFTENRVLVKRFTLWFPTGQKVPGLPPDKDESKIHGTLPEQGQKKKKSWESLLCHRLRQIYP
jgi:hypothetical protein